MRARDQYRTDSPPRRYLSDPGSPVHVWTLRARRCATPRITGGPVPLLREPLQLGENAVALSTILLIVLVLLLIGALPSWPYSRGWGYGPSGGLGLVVVILIILLLMGRI
ncbi:MAG: hypothetical protein DI564_18055 [Rhodanobacter denitrificans]|uniref:DUF3309 domain-containing protein n=1 Tax=Rhodanobacter denitrificans TaxID=666685 RepID=A0A2W5K292_9GAMM|nr:MAG: hypothetical protein DI564_18055 [Rhodanobacter denitrificans]